MGEAFAEGVRHHLGHGACPKGANGHPVTIHLEIGIDAENSQQGQKVREEESKGESLFRHFGSVSDSPLQGYWEIEFQALSRSSAGAPF